jgi:DNA-binding transcriptional LysR family regulator
VRGPVAKLLKHYGAKMEQPIAALLERIAWDDLRVFVVVARTLNFRKAATTLRTSTATVIRRIERLESIFEFRLFNRLLDIVRCSVTEGLGTAWILPQLARFSRGHPATIIHLRCAMEVADVMRMETDVAIQLDKPKRPGAKSVRLGRMHIYPFASREYIETYGVPKSLDDVRHHRIIHQQAPQVDENAVQRWLNLPSIEGIVALRTNTSTAHGRAIELGMGIGGLPTYIMALGSELIPIDIGIKHPVEIWMTYHPDARGVSRVSFFMDWLKTLFDPKRNPWFADEFIHPNELIGREPPPEKTPGVFGLTNRRVAQG